VPDVMARAGQQVRAARYTSAAFAAREAESLWGHVWQAVCREEDLAGAGDFLEYSIGERSLVVIRDNGGALHAFPNVCRHRGTQLLESRGTIGEIRCPFHSWRWSLDGACLAITDPEDFGCPDLERLALPSLPLAIWGGFVFVNFDHACVPFADWIAPIDKLAAPYRMADMRWQSIVWTTVPCNWKVGVEAFIESYHVAGTHPQARCATDGTTATYECLGDHGLMVVPMGKPTPGSEVGPDDARGWAEAVESLVALQHLPKDQLMLLRAVGRGEQPLRPGESLRGLMNQLSRDRAEAGGWADEAFTGTRWFDQYEFHVFPNLVLGVIPGELFGFRFRPDGAKPDSCIFEVLSMRFPSSAEQAWEPVHIPYSRDPAERRADWGPILHQDFANLERVQKGLRGGDLETVRLAGYQESLIAHLHEVIDRYLTDHG
jgi:phenylpropionate dioxygenase-like ring-hydroxylating dioxygenase large terminal subunit